LYDIDHQKPVFGASSWGIMNGDRAPIAWTTDPADGVIQGPVDLCCLAGKLLHLVLERGQVALMCAGGNHKAFFQDGGYLLRIGDGGLPTNGLLYFMHTEHTFEIPWEQVIPVPRSEVSDPVTRLASGSFDVRIESPIRFHAEMLKDRSGEGEAICRDVLARVMPTLLTIRLAHACGRESTRTRQREVLAALDPDDLNPDLAPYGLSCPALRIDESFLETPRPVPVA